MPALKTICRAFTAEAAAAVLAELEDTRGKRHPAIVPLWRRAWAYVVAFVAFPPAVWKMIGTMNAVESLNRGLRKVIKTRGSFPTDEAAQSIRHAPG